MHRLRPSVLLRGPERQKNTDKHGRDRAKHRSPDEILRTALVVATQALFLWMFLAADPLEQAAGSEAGLRFASDWRHGMTGNSLLYMPGFFATAAALWLYDRTGDRRRVAARLLALCGIAGVAAALGAAAGARMAAGDFEAATLGVVPAVLPRPTILGAVRGLYTLATWSAFVLACRTALEERTWRPFLLPAVMAIGLALIRPWTVDDFTTLWKDRVAAGDPVACASAAAVVVMVALLAAASGRSSSVVTRISERGARMARRDDRAYREYVSEEQRSQPGCPARKARHK